MSEARLRMLRGPGWLYAARSRYCDWIKIGFTSKAAKERLASCNKQYAEFAPFSIIGAVQSCWDAEQQLHRILAPFRQRNVALTRELYPAVPSLVLLLNQIFMRRQWDYVEWPKAHDFRAWAIRHASYADNRDLALESFDLFRAERAAPNGPCGGTGTAVPSSQGRASATIERAA